MTLAVDWLTVGGLLAFVGKEFRGFAHAASLELADVSGIDDTCDRTPQLEVRPTPTKSGEVFC